MMHPSSEGKFPGVGSIGTGWGEITEYKLGKKCVVTKKPGYWAGDGALDSIVFIDHGDDPAAALGAIASGQVDGIWEVDTSQIAAVQKLANIQVYQATTAQTGVARMNPTFDTCGRESRFSARRCGWASIRRRCCRSPISASACRRNTTMSRRCIRSTTSCRSCSAT